MSPDFAWYIVFCAVQLYCQNEKVGRTNKQGWAAGSVIQVEAFGHSVQASPLAVPAVICLEALSSSEYGHQFCSDLQRGNAWLHQGSTPSTLCTVVIWTCVWELRFWFLFYFFMRLSMFLHLKKKTRPRVKGSTWLLVILSCGTTTGKLKSVFEATKVFYVVLITMESINVGPLPTPWCTAMK